MPKTEPSTAAELIPPNADLDTLRKSAADCQACDLWKLGTQTVFGEGTRRASLLFVGEQPGNEEDLSGRPFVGPAGRVLATALEEAGIPREKVYITNIVKHFRWEPRGKRRIHKKPNSAQIAACKPWLQAEINVVKPRIVVCLGATAAQALIGKDFKVTQRRGELIESALAPFVMATIHPSAILRASDDQARRDEMRRFIDDLKRVAPMA
jgi:DNA polymerase